VLAKDSTHTSGFERIAYCCAGPVAIMNPSGAISSRAMDEGCVLTHLNKQALTTSYHTLHNVNAVAKRRMSPRARRQRGTIHV
jgi:hypothetical protein